VNVTPLLLKHTRSIPGTFQTQSMHQNLSIKLALLWSIGMLGSSCNGVEESVRSQPALPTIEPSLSRPEYLKPSIDSVSGTTVIRVSDRAAFNSNSQELRHLYAKNQPWNADGSYLLLHFKYPAALLDGRTNRFIRWVRQPKESVWSNVNPSLIYGVFDKSNQFVKLDVAKGDKFTVLHKFDEYDRIDFGAWEGNLSNNDRYAALAGIKAGKLDLLVYDLPNNRIKSRQTQPKNTTIDANTKATINNISMSQSGNYIVVQYNNPGKGVQRGVHLLDRSLKPIRQLSQRGGSHFDSCVDARGSEAIVIQDDTTSAIVSVQYATGKKTTLLPASKTTFNIHISCRNLNRPGWSYISEFVGESDPTKVSPNRTFALKLDGSGTIEQFAQPHQSLSKEYARQPLSVPNRDGKKVLFASDWGNPTDPVYAYITQRK
jgi:hypothetical protein